MRLWLVTVYRSGYGLHWRVQAEGREEAMEECMAKNKYFKGGVWEVESLHGPVEQ